MLAADVEAGGGPLAAALGGITAAAELAQAVADGHYAGGLAQAGAGGSDVDLVLWRLHAATSARSAVECVSQHGHSAIPDLRWPPSSLCRTCWRRCFRRGRFCWDPWEDARRTVAVEVPTDFADALPNEKDVAAFLATWYRWDDGERSEGEPPEQTASS